MTEGEDMRVQLARMEGKLDLSNARHDQVDKRLDNHEQRLHRHSNDISSLQASENLRAGERRGISLTVRMAWALGGSSVVALLALAARSVGL